MFLDFSYVSGGITNNRSPQKILITTKLLIKPIPVVFFNWCVKTGHQATFQVRFFNSYEKQIPSSLVIAKNVVTQSAFTFEVNNRNNRTRCEICSKLTITTPERRLVNFEHVNADWENIF